MPISCHMRDLGFSDSEAPASKGPAPKPTHIEHFFHWQRIGEGGGAAAGAGRTVRSGRGGASLGRAAGTERSRAPVGAGRRPAHRGDGADGAGRRPYTLNDARGGLARRRAFEKVARLTSSWRNWPALAF